ncbi:hypothetical protein ALT1000_120063 [Alteromonas macleodii]
MPRSNVHYHCFFKRYVELTETDVVLLGFKSNIQQNRPPINA